VKYDLIIIGAGAAGLFAAANAPVGFKTLVLEKTDSPGNKLLLTGSGQCNLTNNESIKSFLDRYGKNGKRLRPVLFPFSNLALISYFEERSVPLKVRDDGKIFPATMKSADVLDLLLKLARDRKVEMKFRTEVTELSILNEVKGGGFYVETPNELFVTKNVLVATGGESYPRTGSDGAFFTCLENLGLKLMLRQPALAPVFVNDYPYKNLAGLTFPNSSVMLTCKENNAVSPGGSHVVEGSLLFTHKGFSGPAVLEVSRYVTQGDELVINYMAGKTSDNLRRELLGAASGDPRQIITVLQNLTNMPRSFLEAVCVICDINRVEKASRLTGTQIREIAKKLTADSFEISGVGGFNIAMVTSGGVCLDEINMHTMEAGQYPGLYFAGEVLDVDGDTGGYNLQFAFSSAKRCMEAIQGDKPAQTSSAVDIL